MAEGTYTIDMGDDANPDGFHGYVLPDDRRVSMAELERMRLDLVPEGRGRRASVPWENVEQAAAARAGDTKLRGRRLRQACETWLAAEIIAGGHVVPRERHMRTHVAKVAARVMANQRLTRETAFSR